MRTNKALAAAVGALKGELGGIEECLDYDDLVRRVLDAFDDPEGYFQSSWGRQPEPEEL